MRRYFSRKILFQNGQTLLMALLIMAGVTAAGIGMSTIILNQIKQAGNVSEAIEATYKAESALEKSLYVIKRERRADHTLDNTLGVITNEVTSDDFDVSVSKEVQETEVNIKENETYQFDLFDPDSLEGLGQDVDAIYVSWDNNPCDVTSDYYGVDCSETPSDCCFGGGLEWAEISWAGWDALGNWSDYSEKKLLSSLDLVWTQSKKICPEPGEFGEFKEKADFEAEQCYLIKSPELSKSYPNYRVKVKALYDDIDGLEVKPVDTGSGTIIDVYSRVIIKAVGKTGRTQQALQIDAPWKIPLSGILDFTLFSEEPIDK